MLIILLGAPGAGKGSQAKLLAKKYNLRILATGEILRNAIKEKTELGKKVKGIISSGNLLPDNILCSVMEDKLKEEMDCDGYMLDGFPRTIYQADKLNEIIACSKSGDLYIVSLNLDEEKIIARLSSRIFCKNCNQSYNLITKPTKVHNKCDVCGHIHFYTRDDDNQDAIKVRLASYERQTKPLIEYYREYKNYIEINAAQTIEDIQYRIGSFIKDN